MQRTLQRSDRIRHLYTTLALATVACLPAQAATHTVCASGCDYSSIQNAANAASAGDTLELSAQTFTEGEISIAKNLTVRTASGRATIDAVGGDYVFKIGANKVVRLEDLNLKGADDAMLINYGITTLSTVFVLGDGFDTRFGGILNTGSTASLKLTDSSVVSSNSSAGLGGGITNYADLVIENSTVIGNQGHRGGGVFNWKGTVSVQSSSFSGNHATVRGGAWYNGHLDGSMAFHSSASTSSNTADVACDTSYDAASSTPCVN